MWSRSDHDDRGVSQLTGAGSVDGYDFVEVPSLRRFAGDLLDARSREGGVSLVLETNDFLGVVRPEPRRSFGRFLRTLRSLRTQVRRPPAVRRVCLGHRR